MSGELVFVVDDDLSVRRSIRRLLEGRGYRVRMFDAVRPAQVELAGHSVESPACVIVDVRMPGADGFELVESLPLEIPVVLITGHTEESTSDRARSLGVSQVVMKPFDEDGLLKAVSLAVPPRSVRRPLN